MTSGTFTLFPLSSVSVRREMRQRRELTGIEELAASIRSVGLINPIIITREGELIAGERRFSAVTSLGWDHIPAQFTDELDPVQLHLIELEENIKRVDLSWLDRTTAIAEYHRLRTSTNAEHSVEDTARAVGLTTRSVNQNLFVAKNLEEVPEAATRDKFSNALNTITRKKERAKTVALRDLDEDISPEVPIKDARRVELLQVDFLEWSKTPRENPFNLLHVDFPYGINTGDKTGQSATKSFIAFDDSEDHYWNLIAMLLQRQDNFVAPSAHMLFWFSMKLYERTRLALTEGGWQVSPTPLIWGKSDNTGILPDPNRGPRQTYETAFLCTRGDRKVVRPVANIFWGPTTKDFHPFEKSLSMLSHFFRMLVDESTRMLDPTAGSAMALRAAETAGAVYSLGLESEPEFFAAAQTNLKLEASE